MRKKQVDTDPFSNRVRGILIGSSLGEGKTKFREMIVAEVRNYSREVQDTEAMSELFTRLCDLIVDCQSAGIPDESFKLLVAHLLYETSFSAAPLDRELQALTGMDILSIREAREHLKGECIQGILLNK